MFFKTQMLTATTTELYNARDDLAYKSSVSHLYVKTTHYHLFHTREHILRFYQLWKEAIDKHGVGTRCLKCFIRTSISQIICLVD